MRLAIALHQETSGLASAERPRRVDLCPTQTDRWQASPSVRRRTGFGHEESFVEAAISISVRLLGFVSGRSIPMMCVTSLAEAAIRAA
jgi:hypothetical protein